MEVPRCGNLLRHRPQRRLQLGLTDLNVKLDRQGVQWFAPKLVDRDLHPSPCVCTRPPGGLESELTQSVPASRYLGVRNRGDRGIRGTLSRSSRWKQVSRERPMDCQCRKTRRSTGLTPNRARACYHWLRTDERDRSRLSIHFACGASTLTRWRIASRCAGSTRSHRVGATRSARCSPATGSRGMPRGNT